MRPRARPRALLLAFLAAAPALGLALVPAPALAQTGTAARAMQFVEPIALTLPFVRGGSVSGIATGDLDGDGRIDIAVAEEHGGRAYVNVLLGAGGATFATGPSVAFAPDVHVGGLLAHDLDRDGALDLVVGTSEPALAILRGRGDASFDDARSIALPGSPSTFQLADVDRDGALDAVALVPARSAVAIVRGSPSGLGTTATSVALLPEGASATGFQDLAVADLDGNGAPDLVVTAYDARQAIVLLNDGAGAFATRTATPLEREPVGLYAAEVDGDAKIDLVIGTVGCPTEEGSGCAALLRGNGNGTFAAASYSPSVAFPRRGGAQTGAPDLDGNGKPDFVFGAGGENVVAVGLHDGAGGFRVQKYVASSGPGFASTYLETTDTGIVHVADVDGDGRADVLVGQVQGNARPGGLSILLGAGAGALRAPRSFPSPLSTTTRPMTLGDFNGDGNLDLVAIADALAFLAGRGDGTFSAPTVALGHIGGPGEFYNTIRSADFDGDGKLDVAFLATSGVQGGPAPRHVVAFGNGDGTFTSLSMLSPRVNDWAGRNALVGDVNEDGRPDLVVFTSALYGQAVEIAPFLWNGSRSFRAAPALGVGVVPGTTGVGSGFALADFTGDGHLDVLARSGVREAPFEGTGVGHDRFLFFRGRGDGTFDDAIVSPPTPTGTPEMNDFVAADLDGDGKRDAIGFGGNEGWFMRGHGNGSFADPTPFPAGISPYTAALSDLDADGVPDLAIAHDGCTCGNGLTVHKGRANGTFEPAIQLAIGAQVASGLVVGDLDGDGLPELVVGHTGSARDRFTVLRNAAAPAVPARFAYALREGWNLVSIPLATARSDPASLFDGHALAAWTWTGKRYERAGTLEPGAAYWILSDEDAIVTIEGTHVESVALDVAGGWSLVGGPTRPALLHDLPCCIDTNVLQGDGATSTFLMPGVGYWMRDGSASAARAVEVSG